MNFKQLAENLGLEEDEYMELIELFIETGISDLEKLNSAIDEGNGEEAANAAHSIKGAAGNLGLVDLSETAKEIEEKARNNRLEEIAESAQALKGKLEEIAERAGDEKNRRVMI
jgi:HPt (histidine-containing phosphotransfer) domain-containing protein